MIQVDRMSHKAGRRLFPNQDWRQSEYYGMDEMENDNLSPFNGLKIID